MASPVLIFRHPLMVRLTHWINLFCVVFLLGSGLQIFNAHPALYWSEASTFDDPIFALGAELRGGRPVGVATFGDLAFETTGYFGLFTDELGQYDQRGFPAWMTLPSWRDLSTGRRWHFFFAWIFVANGLAYLLFTLASGRAVRELLPTRAQLRGLPRTIADHVRLRFPRGEAARHYNGLQRLAYFAIAFVVLPLLVLAGLAMSPGLDAALPWLPAMFGGRQAARSVHFLAAFALVLFTLVHVAMVLASGLWNNLRSMITGRYAIDAE